MNVLGYTTYSDYTQDNGPILLGPYAVLYSNNWEGGTLDLLSMNAVTVII
jgi:hypothetical protein